MSDGDQQSPQQLRDQLPTSQLGAELRELGKLTGRRVLRAVTSSRQGGDGSGLAGAVRSQVAEPVKEGVKKTGLEKAGRAAQSSSASSGPGNLTNIVEEIDVGVPLRVAYDQWTSFTDFPTFMKQVENVSDVSDTELKWRGRVLWSRRHWTTEIVEQVPYQRLVWRSEGEKGRVEGAVSFHEIAPNLTKILLVLEYYPQGLLEKTANLWRAQGRRVRLELKHFRRHVMTQTALHPSEVEGRRSTIHDGEVREESVDEGEP